MSATIGRESPLVDAQSDHAFANYNQDAENAKRALLLIGVSFIIAAALTKNRARAPGAVFPPLSKRNLR